MPTPASFSSFADDELSELWLVLQGRVNALDLSANDFPRLMVSTKLLRAVTLEIARRNP